MARGPRLAQMAPLERRGATRGRSSDPRGAQCDYLIVVPGADVAYHAPNQETQLVASARGGVRSLSPQKSKKSEWPGGMI